MAEERDRIYTAITSKSGSTSCLSIPSIDISVPVSRVFFFHGDHIVHVKDRRDTADFKKRSGEVVGVSLIGRAELARNPAGYGLAQNKFHRIRIRCFLNITYFWHDRIII